MEYVSNRLGIFTWNSCATCTSYDIFDIICYSTLLHRTTAVEGRAALLLLLLLSSWIPLIAPATNIGTWLTLARCEPSPPSTKNGSPYSYTPCTAATAVNSYTLELIV